MYGERVKLLLAAALLLALPASARAAQPRVPLAPGVQVVVGPCPDPAQDALSSGCTYPGGAIVYVDDANDTVTLYHELGHQFAYRVLDDSHAQMSGGMLKFAHLTRVRFGGARAPATVREMFADAYATCALGENPEPYEWGNRNDFFPTGAGYDPTPHTNRMVCAMIVRAGARLGLS